jgi:hypothetical protein
MENLHEESTPIVPILLKRMAPEAEIQSSQKYGAGRPISPWSFQFVTIMLICTQRYACQSGVENESFGKLYGNLREALITMSMDRCLARIGDCRSSKDLRRPETHLVQRICKDSVSLLIVES